MLAVAAILVRRLLVQIGPAWGSRRMLLVGSTGGILGVISAGPALLAVAADPADSLRAGWSWAALVLSPMAGSAA